MNRREKRIQLTPRQLTIIELVKKQAPIVGEQIAELLGLSRPTIRSDLSLLVMIGYLDAKPKVGYFLGDKSTNTITPPDYLLSLQVSSIQGLPVNIQDTASIHDAVVLLFLENVGSITVINASGHLVGIVSRKDLLKITVGNQQASQLPVSMVMTRVPNVITSHPDELVIDAAYKMIHHQVDALPVVIPSATHKDALEIVARITKTTMTQVLLNLALNPNE